MPGRTPPEDAAPQGIDFHRTGEGITRGTTTLLVHPDIDQKAHTRADRSPEARLEEARGLAEAIHLNVKAARIVRLRQVTPATLIGKGKLGELADIVEAQDIDLVIFDCALSPIQQRNLERALKAKVIDRTGLILEIFGERAATREGVLQVELAHLEYQKGRLVRSWTHLERQRGALGFIGGPGERQIEADRRQLQERIQQIKSRLGKVRKTRDIQRRSRHAVPFPVVALVGYTNAGKSTLFNALSRAEVTAADQLFQTLDPTMRAVELASGRKIILSDTVGFISDLPTELVAAFRATLEEVLQADLILHVRDIASPETGAQRRDVQHVLASLGIDEEAQASILEVWNKIDRLEGEALRQVKDRASARPDCIAVSALTGEGLARLESAIEKALGADEARYEIRLPVSAGRAAAWLHRNGVVKKENMDRETLILTVRLSEKDAGQFTQEFPDARMEKI